MGTASGGGGRLLAGGEGVVPVVGGWPQASDGGVEGNHPGCEHGSDHIRQYRVRTRWQ